MDSRAEQLVYHSGLNKVTGLLRSCSHSLRLKIIEYIHCYPSTNVNNIYRALHIAQPVVSQQLKILRDADLVLANRQGRQVLYSLNYTILSKLSKSVHKYFSA